MISSVEKIYSHLNNEFVSYKITLSNGEKWFVPLDPANTDYQSVQEWIAEGNLVIDPGAN